MNQTNDAMLSARQKLFVKNALRDPVLFATHILGLDLWPREAEILRAIRDHRRTAIKACHGVGKTFTLAVATLWWLARYPEGVVLMTSPTQRQVEIALENGSISRRKNDPPESLDSGWAGREDARGAGGRGCCGWIRCASYDTRF